MSPLTATNRPVLVRWLVAGLLFGGTVLLFSRAIGYDFLNYDDPRYVAANAQVQAPFGWSSIVWAFTARSELWQPLAWLSHIFDWQMYGANAAGHHLSSVLWHALNAVLALVVFRRLGGTLWTSAFAAALFAWHPLRVESAAWISERKDVMSGTFFLLTIWAYLGYGQSRVRAKAVINGETNATESSRPAPQPIGTKAASYGRYALTLAFFAAGLMCKPTLVTLPFLLLALDSWPLGRMKGSGSPTAGVAGMPERGHENWRWLLLEKTPFLFLSLLVGLVTLRLQAGYGAFTLDLPLGARLANIPVAIARYLGKFFWPTDLSVCYPHPGWWPIPFVIFSVLLVGTITFAAWYFRRSLPWMAVGWVWFLALLLPTIGIVQVGFQSMADRYTYLPLFGWELALLWTLRGICVRGVPSLLTLLAAVAVLLGCAVRTWQQEAVWRDSVTLFRHAIAASGSSATSEGMLGYTLASVGRNDEAVVHCERAIALDPKNEMSVYTLAGIRAQQGRTEDAIAGYRRSLELRPNEPGTEFDLAVQLLHHGDTAEAAKYFADAARQAPELIRRNHELAADGIRTGNAPLAALHYLAGTLMEPNNARVHFEAGAALVRLGRDGEALPCLQRAVVLMPDLVEAQVELGLLLLNHREPMNAAPHFRAALRLNPKLADANVGLGRVEESLGHATEADAYFKQALDAAPESADVARAWADVLARRGQFSDAVAYYRRAVTLRPNDATNQAGLGYALLLSGHRAEAAAAWREALRLDPNFPGLREHLQQLGM